MKHETFLLAFVREGGITFPVDRELHRMAIEWASANLAVMPNFSDYMKVFVACRVDDNRRPVEVEGVIALQQVIDVPLFRFTSQTAAKSLIDRTRDWLEDNGMRGGEILLYVSATEAPEQRCPQYLDWMQYVKAEAADRYKIRVW